MKTLGVVRKLDELGRVVMPKEFRDEHEIKNGDPVEIFNTNKGILIKHYDTAQELSYQIELLENAVQEKKLKEEVKNQVIEHISNIKGLLEET